MKKTAKIPNTDETVAYRTPMRVKAVRAFYTLYGGLTTYPVCPRCRKTMEREYQAYCENCGQALGWKDFHKGVILLPDRRREDGDKREPIE